MKRSIPLIALVLLVASCKKSSAIAVVAAGNNNSAAALNTDITEPAAVRIGTQVWMIKNLIRNHYNNGDEIPQVKNATKWANLTTGAWCWYNNDSASGAVYGKFYNWYAVHDQRGLAPEGWHIPSDLEWDTLAARLGGYSIAGDKMKDTGTFEAGTGLWYTPNTGLQMNWFYRASGRQPVLLGRILLYGQRRLLVEFFGV